MIYYIIDKKANNFIRILGFVVIVIVAACGFFCVYILSTSLSFVACLLFISRPPHLYLLCLSESSVPSASSVAFTICIFRGSFCLRLLSMPCLLYLRLLYIGKMFAPSVSSMTCSICVFVVCSISVYCLCIFYSVCVYYALVSCLFYLHLLWLVLFTSAVYTSSALFASAMSWWVVYFICVFCKLFCLNLLSILYLLRLCLLCLGKLFIYLCLP